MLFPLYEPACVRGRGDTMAAHYNMVADRDRQTIFLARVIAVSRNAIRLYTLGEESSIF
jgi:hypothetical protein